MDEFTQSILNADQLSDYENIVNYKKQSLEQLYNSFKNQTLTKQEIHRKMMGVIEWFSLQWINF